MDSSFVTSIFFFAGSMIGFTVSLMALKRNLNELSNQRNRYRQLSGWSEQYGFYDLESFDGGRTWYGMLTLADGRRLVLGQAEQIYPGILSDHGIAGKVVEQKHLTKPALSDESAGIDSLSQTFLAIERELEKKKKISPKQMDKQKLCGKFSMQEVAAAANSLRSVERFGEENIASQDLTCNQVHHSGTI